MANAQSYYQVRRYTTISDFPFKNAKDVISQYKPLRSDLPHDICDERYGRDNGVFGFELCDMDSAYLYNEVENYYIATVFQLIQVYDDSREKVVKTSKLPELEDYHEYYDLYKPEMDDE